MSQSKLIPKISYKGVFIFILVLFLGVLLIPVPLKAFHLSKVMSYFISAGISASVGLSLVVTIIDGHKDDQAIFKKRILISTIVGFATSALIILVFGGDIVG